MFCALLATTLIQTTVDLPRFPSLSPNGDRICFSWRGDLWSASSSGGHAQRLTAHPANETRSAWSPDGTEIVFESDRDGVRNLWCMAADGTGVRQLTTLDRPVTLSAVAEEQIWFSAYLELDVYRSERPYMIPRQGGDPVRLHDAFGATPVPGEDGQMFFVRGGYYDGWARRHFRSAECADVWSLNADGTFTQLTTWSGNDGWPASDGQGHVLYLSDAADRTVNLWRQPKSGGQATQITTFTDMDIHDWSMAANGNVAIAHRWDQLHRIDFDGESTTVTPLTITAPSDEMANAVQSLSGRTTQAALSPDGKTVALIAGNDLYVRDAEGKRPARLVFGSEGREEDPVWSTDGNTLWFVSDLTGTRSIHAAEVTFQRSDLQPEDTAAPDASQEPSEEHGSEDDSPASEEQADAEPPMKSWHEALGFKISDVLVRSTEDRNPQAVPGGKGLVFRSTRGQIEYLDFESMETRVLFEHWDSWIDFDVSPDGEWMAYAQHDLDFNSDIFLMRLDGAQAPINITRHPDNDEHPRFSADGRLLVFTSERKAEAYDIMVVALDAEYDGLLDADQETYHEEAKKAAADRDHQEATPNVWSWSLDDAWLRLRRLTTLEGDETRPWMTPGGEAVVFQGSGSNSGLHRIDWKGENRTKIGTGSVQGFSTDGKRLLRVDKGTAVISKTDGKDSTKLGVTARKIVDHSARNRRKILAIGRDLGETYYDPNMGGCDWENLVPRYAELAAGCRTNEAFDWVANRLIGEVNGSHMGVRSPSDVPSGAGRTPGRLGIDSKLTPNGIELAEIVPFGPAATATPPLEPGDQLVMVNFSAIAGTSLRQLLQGTIGNEVAVTVLRGEAEITSLLTPISWREERQLRYEAWRRATAEFVEKATDGRVGYIHIQGMNQPSLEVFERDLYAACAGKEALILDVRNNGGGWTTDRVLASIMAPVHAWTTPRGADPAMTGHYPQDRLFIQRTTMPINLLCNEKSYSNAEIMSHAFKTVGRGTLVGMPTHGSVISTGSFSLEDGTTVRMPFRGWYVADQSPRDMELNGAIPDLMIPQTPEDESTQTDTQLKVALEDLLKRVR